MNNASMILRILAILGAVAAAVMFYIIGDTKDQLKAELQTTESQLSQTEGELSTVQGERDELTEEVAALEGDLEETEAQVVSLNSELSEVRAELASANQALSTQEEEAEDLQEEARRIRRELLDERTRVSELEGAMEEGEDSSALQASIRELERQLLETERQIQTTGGGDEDPAEGDETEEPQSQVVRGQIVEVGENGSFVLFDRGAAEGVREDSTVMIRRGAQYIGRATVTEVHDDLSVARVRPGAEEIRTGDIATTLN